MANICCYVCFMLKKAYKVIARVCRHFNLSEKLDKLPVFLGDLGNIIILASLLTTKGKTWLIFTKSTSKALTSNVF